MTSSPASASFKYSAFISYSHEDERWAKWLQNELETYRVPARLVGRQTPAGVIPRRLAPVCRDRSDLPGATDLGAHINEALRAAANLIVICSPSASTSRWVNEEIRMFMRLGRSDRVFCLIVAGEPNASDLHGREAEECFAPALRFACGADGAPTGRGFEPIAADVRSGRDGKSNAKLKLLSGLLDVGFDELKQREHRRHTQRLAVVTVVALVIMLITTGLAIEAVIERHSAERHQKQAENLVDFMLGDLNDKLRQVQRLDILEAVDNHAMAYFLSLPTTDVTDQTLAQRVKALNQIGSVREDQGKLPAALESYRAASALAAELLRRAPDEAARAIAYAVTLNRIGETNWFQGNLEQALGNFQQAIAWLEKATAHQPSSAGLAELASARTNAGRVLEERGEFAAANTLYEAVQATFIDLVSREPGTARWRSELAFAYDNLGKLALKRGQLKEAIDAYRDVRRITGELSAKDPRDRDAQEALLLSSAILGGTLALCGSDAEAVRYVREAVSTAKALVAIDTTQTGWREEFGDYSRLLGGLERSAGRLEEAAGLDGDALRVLGELVATDTTNTGWRRDLAYAQLESARLQLARGDLLQADHLLALAIAAITRERATNPGARNLVLLEARARLALGQVLAQRGNLPGARAEWIRARDAIATPARVGADPNFLAAWASALLLLEEAEAARPLVEQLASIGYRTPDFDALLAAKKQPNRSKSVAAWCGGDASGVLVGSEMQ